MNYKILVVDDESANTRMLERALRNDYEVLSASSGAEGLELLTIHDVALIISDQRMPAMTGVEFLMRSAEMRPQCVRIILTGYTDAGSLVDALNSGVVYKYITKPWVQTDLLQAVTRGLAHHETLKAQHRLKLENERLRDRVQADDACFVRLCGELQYVKNEAAPATAARTRRIAEDIGRALKMDPVALDRLSSAAYLHRVADINVPDELAQKNGELTDRETSVIRLARERALALLADIPGFEEIADLVRHQFEYFDGTHSPEGLRGEQIPLGSRIVAVAKEFDGLISSASEADAVDAIRAAGGSRFDPLVVEAFCRVAASDSTTETKPELTFA